MGWGSAIKKPVLKKTAEPVIQMARATAFELAHVDWDRLVTLDFETYYDQDYTLKKLSTSEYIRDPRFKAQMVGIKIGRKPVKVYTGARIKTALQAINWTTHSLLAHNCVPGDTEVLTRQGWRPIKDVPSSIEIMQWDSRTNEATWCVPLGKTESKTDRLLSWDTLYHRGAYTPEHRFYYSTPDKPEWQVKTTQEVAELSPNNVYVPISGLFAGKEEVLADAEVRLMEAIRADGSWILDNGKCYGVQFNLRKPHKIERLREIVGCTGLELKGPSTYGRWRLCKSALLDRIYELLGRAKVYDNWLLDFPLRQRVILLEELYYWDGSDTGRDTSFSWSTADPKTAETIETIAHLSGYSFSGTWKDNARGYNEHNPNAALCSGSIRRKQKVKLVERPTEIKGRRNVYCFTVPTGAFFIRAGGRVSITGNCAFDGFILSHHYGIVPQTYYDTLSMARGLHSNEIGGSLDEVSIFYGGEGKIDGVLETTLGVKTWSKQLIASVTPYCVQDTDECHRIFSLMHPKFPADEMALVDMTIRMFCDPVLEVDIPRVKAEYEREVEERKRKLIAAIPDFESFDFYDEKGKYKGVLDKASGRDTLEGEERQMAVAKKVIGSNEKFVALLVAAGVPEDKIPVKISPAWMKLRGQEREEQIDKKWTYAFAKDDLQFVDLAEKVWDLRPDLDPESPGDVVRAVTISGSIQLLVDARLTVKSTTNITRAERFMKAGANGMKLPAGYSYYRAHCLTGDAQVLTRGGWVALEDWRGGEIAQWSPDGSIRFAPATPNSFRVRENLVRAKSRYHSSTYTKGHTLPAFASTGKFRTRRAGEALEARFDIPISGVLDGSANITPLEAQIAVMVQADGNVRSDVGRGLCVRFGFKKTRKIERCKALLTEAGIGFTEAREGDVVRIRVGAKHYAQMIRWVGAEKMFSAELFDAPAETKKAFVSELAFWDGSVEPQPKGFSYSTTNAYNAQFVATMAHLAGRSAFTTSRPREKGWSPAFVVYIRSDKKTRSAPQHYEEIPHDGLVYCPTTETGYFMVRQHGNIVVTGNTGRWGGNNKMNMQNLKRGGELRLSILAAKGHSVAVCDSGQIEARVNGWLWGQEDLLDAFRVSDAYAVEVAPFPKDKRRKMRVDERDAYCRFGDIVYGRTIWKEDELERFIGKVCLAEGELVLTNRGLVPINLLSSEDRLWDGVEWVSHDGLVDQGIQEVITYEGLTATPDHEVFTEDGRIIPLGQAASEMARLQVTGAQGRGLRFCDSAVVADTPRQRLSVRQGPMRPDWYYEADVAEQLAFGKNDIVSEEWSPAYAACGNPRPTLRRDRGAVYQPCTPPMARVRGPGHQTPVLQSNGVHPVGGGQPPTSELPASGDRPVEQRRSLRAGQSAACDATPADQQPPQHREGGVAGFTGIAGRFPQPAQPDRYGAAGQTGADGRADPGARTAERGTEAQELALDRRQARVYDIANAGPRRRFTVSGKLVLNCVLGLGYQMGAAKFQMTLAKGALGGPRVNFPLTQCQQIVNAYRAANPQIVAGWKKCKQIIEDMAAGVEGSHKCISWGGDSAGGGWILLPNGMTLKYPDLKKAIGEQGYEEWTYQSGDMRKKIYGGLLCENLVQALARIIVACQMLMINKKYRVVMTTHDEAVAHVKTSQAQKCYEFMYQCFTTPLPWCPDIPLAAEGGHDTNYSK